MKNHINLTSVSTISNPVMELNCSAFFSKLKEYFINEGKLQYEFLPNTNMYLCYRKIAIQDFFPDFKYSLLTYFSILNKNVNPQILFYDHESDEYFMGIGENSAVEKEDFSLLMEKEIPFFITLPFQGNSLNQFSKNDGNTLPLISISKGHISFSIVSKDREAPLLVLHTILSELSNDFHETGEAHNGLKVEFHSMTPCFKDFEANINRFKEQENLNKVVLARKKTFKTNSSQNVLSTFLNNYLAEKLTEKENFSSYLFIYKKNNDLSFVSTTPELFLKKVNNEITLDSLAGTRKRDFNYLNDLEIEKELTLSLKDNEEQDIVTSGIYESLSPYILDKNHKRDKKVLKLKSLMHLKTIISGILKENFKPTHLFNLISDLHPSAAVGGHPKRNALQFLDQFENFDREIYAAPMGIVTGHNALLVVGIRSGIISKNEVHLFAGAGIIKNSNAIEEWQEIENKFEHMEKYFK